jgi:hypothetical protein
MRQIVEKHRNESFNTRLFSRSLSGGKNDTTILNPLLFKETKY